MKTPVKPSHWLKMYRNGEHSLSTYIDQMENEREKLIEALQKIAKCKQGDVVKYIQYVDGVALDALAEVEE